MNYMMLLGVEPPAPKTTTGRVNVPEGEKRTSREIATEKNKARGAKNRASREKRILAFIDIDLKSLGEIASNLRIHKDTARSDLRLMEQAGLVRMRKVATENYYWRPAR